MTDKAEQLRENISNINTAEYSPAVMANKALILYATEELDSLFDVSPEQIPYIAYLKAINSQIPIPATMEFIKNQLSLSRSKDRQGRKEFGQALNKQPVILPGGQGALNIPGMMQEEKPGIISRLLKRKKGIEE